jgi:hypothetical protein
LQSNLCSIGTYYYYVPPPPPLAHSLTPNPKV